MALHSKTNVIMHSGEVRLISSLQIGDLLMGEDSSPRKIISLKSVIASTYEVKPVRGMPYITDSQQALILQKSIYLVNKEGHKVKKYFPKYRHFPNRILVTVQNVLVKNSTSLFKCFFLHKAKLIFPHTPVNIDPYFIGLWLGDGTRHLTSITSMDEPIISEIYHQAKKWGLKVSINAKQNNRAAAYSIVRGNVAGFGREKNPLFNQLKVLNLINNKHVPSVYLYNSESVRLELLAGFIDTDGHIRHNVYEAFQKSQRVANDICWLANSLGFRSYVKIRTKRIKSISFEGQYYTLTICGDINRIPVRLSRKKVENISIRHDRRYTGFRIYPTHLIQELVSLKTDGDNIFLLEDGTVLSGETENVPEFNSYWSRTKEAVWNAKFEDFRNFMAKHGKYPERGKESTANEKRLKNWFTNNVQRMKLGYLNIERLEKFKTLILDSGGQINEKENI
ncbi:MAG: LAGLIDADG family homing endonuclease [Cyclobacteriaceae bacterium]|jgi:replicative DNA helicase